MPTQTVRMQTRGWVPVPRESILEATQKRVIEGRVFIAAGSLIDASKIDKKVLGRMMDKSYPDLVDPDVVIDEGKNTRVYQPKGGAKIPVPRSRGREHTRGGE